LAEHIVEIFLSLKEKMKFVSVIYNGSEWNGSGLKFPHVDEEHKTHIHIQWGDAGVATAGFASDLEDALHQQFSADNLASCDYQLA
jgi:hypothetical protein